MKHAILVVGTGRSGTSALTGMIQILGAHLGEPLKPGDASNPKGYFENTRLTDLHKRLLSEAGIAWLVSPPVVSIGATPDRCAAVEDHVAKIFGDRSPIAIKDPRLCVLIDVYVPTLRRMMGYEVHCVRISRDPVEVARSIITATGMQESHWLPIVHRHAELLDAAIRGNTVDCIDCAYADLVDRPKETVDRVVSRLPFLSIDRVDAACAFVDRSLRHHHADGRSS